MHERGPFCQLFSERIWGNAQDNWILKEDVSSPVIREQEGGKLGMTSGGLGFFPEEGCGGR